MEIYFGFINQILLGNYKSHFSVPVKLSMESGTVWFWNCQSEKQKVEVCASKSNFDSLLSFQKQIITIAMD